MPTASDIQKLGTAPRRSTDGLQHEGRPFRERLLDFAKEYETLQARYDQLILSNQDLKVKLELTSNQRELRSDSAVEERFAAEVAQLREQVSRSESQGMQDQAKALAEEVSRLQKCAAEKEAQLEKAEAAIAEEARRAAEARRQADLKAKSQEEMVQAAEERTQAAEARAERAEARLQDLTQELQTRKATEERLLREQAEREKRQADEAAAARADAEEAVARAKAMDAEAAEARARADAEMKAAAKETARADAETKAAADARAQAEAEAKAAEPRRIAEASARLEADAKANAEERQEVLGRVKKELQPKGSTQAKAVVPRKSTKWTEDDLDSGDRREGIAHVLPNLGKLLDSDWHGSYEHSPIAKARLFVFYGAGSRGASFGPWQKIVKNLFPEIEMVVFEYPGHGGHRAELCSDVGQLEQEFSQQVIQFKEGFQNYFNCPFAVIGQSAGARFGLNMIRKLCGIGARAEKFYVVGRSPPLVPSEPPETPRSTSEFLDWVGDTILTSSKEVFKTLLSGKSPAELAAEEQMWRADIAMNSSSVPQLPRKWLVGQSGKLIKRPDSDLARRVRIEREPGSELYVTGEEERGKGGERWVKIDTTRDNVKPGWWLVNGSAVGLNEELLEPLDVSSSEPVDEHSLFWKAPVPFQIHYSTGDVLAPSEDPTGQQRPLREWNRLTQHEPEFVEHEGLLHDELLMHKDVLEYICHDFARTCRLR